MVLRQQVTNHKAESQLVQNIWFVDELFFDSLSSYSATTWHARAKVLPWSNTIYGLISILSHSDKAYKISYSNAGNVIYHNTTIKGAVPTVVIN